MAKLTDVEAEAAALKNTVVIAVKAINDLQDLVANSGLTPAQEDSFLAVVKQARADIEEALKPPVVPAPPPVDVP